MPVDTTTLRGAAQSGSVTKSIAGSVTTIALGADEARGEGVILAGARTAACTVTFPVGTENAGRSWIVENQTTGDFAVNISNVGGTAFRIPNGYRGRVQWTGTVFVFAEGAVQEAEILLSAPQVKALRATPITMVAAPGAGKTARFLGASLFLDYGGNNGFTESADNLAFRYVDGSGVIVSQTVETTGFIDQTADTGTTAEPKIDVIAAKAAMENVAIVLHNTGDGEIAGNAADDNVVRVRIRFAVYNTGW